MHFSYFKLLLLTVSLHAVTLSASPISSKGANSASVAGKGSPASLKKPTVPSVPAAKPIQVAAKPKSGSTAPIVPHLSCAIKTGRDFSEEIEARSINETSSVVRRVFNPEFIGYHGTSSRNANAYLKAACGLNPQIPVLNAFNGADGELGSGLYVADDITTAQFFATTASNALKNSGASQADSAPMICAVAVNDGNQWRNAAVHNKFWIPHQDVATLVNHVNDPVKLTAQQNFITHNGGAVADAVRFSVLNIANPANLAASNNQLMIPVGAFPEFHVTNCAPVSNQVAQLPGDFGTPTFPAFNYQNLQAVWNIFFNAL